MGFDRATRAGVRVFCGMLLLAIFNGCGDSGPELGSVSGTVTLDSKPLEGAFVYFRPAEGGRGANAVTDSQGHYELTYTAARAGGLVGLHNVEITTLVIDDGSGEILRPELVPGKYNRDSELTFDIQSGTNQADFALQGQLTEDFRRGRLARDTAAN